MYPWQKSFKNYFDILEVSNKASIEVIQASYKALAKKYHPDMNAETSNIEKIQDLNEAYSVLKDPEMKKLYEESLLEAEHLSYFSPQYLKQWEQSLRKKEEELQKLKQNEDLKNFTVGSKTPLEKILEHFYQIENLSVNDIEYFKNLSLEDLEPSLQKILNSYKLSLSHESLALEIILELSLASFQKDILKAFKYKPLYPKLFEYIKYYNLIEYLPKVEDVTKRCSFNLKENLEFTLSLLDLYDVFYTLKEVKKLHQKIKKDLSKKKNPLYSEDLEYEQLVRNILEVL